MNEQKWGNMLICIYRKRSKSLNKRNLMTTWVHSERVLLVGENNQSEYEKDDIGKELNDRGSITNRINEDV